MLKHLCFFQTIMAMMHRQASVDAIVMLYLGMCLIVKCTQGTVYHKISPHITNSTSLNCTILNYRSNIETAVGCTNDWQCRAVWSSEKNGGNPNFALCNCMMGSAYGHLVKNGQSTLDLKTNVKIGIGELLLYVYELVVSKHINRADLD